MNTNVSVETLTDLSALAWQRGVNDLVLVRSVGMIYQHLPPGDATVSPPDVIQAADGGLWKALSSAGDAISSESPTGSGARRGQFWHQVVNGRVVGMWVWNGTSWLPVGQ